MSKLFLTILLCLSAQSALASGPCGCKCVVKTDDGKFDLETGSGKDREAAGESLKKALGKRKCELSPECTGKCWPKD